MVAAIILWHTVDLERAVYAMQERGKSFDAVLLKHVALIHWNHISLMGDYLWKQSKLVEKGEFRPLLPFPKP